MAVSAVAGLAGAGSVGALGVGGGGSVVAVVVVAGVTVADAAAVVVVGDGVLTRVGSAGDCPSSEAVVCVVGVAVSWRRCAVAAGSPAGAVAVGVPRGVFGGGAVVPGTEAARRGVGVGVRFGGGALGQCVGEYALQRVVGVGVLFDGVAAAGWRRVWLPTVPSALNVQPRLLPLGMAPEVGCPAAS